MLDFSGIEYRLWAEAGAFALLGVVLLLLYWGGHKKCLVPGLFGAALGLGLAVWYGFCIWFPSIETISAVFDYAERNTRVSPLLPFTAGYTFWDEQGNAYGFYLDTFSAKTIAPNGFVQGEQYLISYETRNHIIVGVESIIQQDMSEP